MSLILKGVGIAFLITIAAGFFFAWMGAKLAAIALNGVHKLMD